MSGDRFTWVEFYSELADRLLVFKKDRPALIGKLRQAYSSIGMDLPRLDSVMPPVDMDPFTVFGLFNKGITEENRRKIISAIADAFEVGANQPEDFDGIPVLNNLNATFYAFASDGRRGTSDIDNLWEVFESGLALADGESEKSRRRFEDAYDAAFKQFGLGWKLTMGLFWARPLFFVNLDSRSRWYLSDMAMAGPVIAEAVPKERASVPDGGGYLVTCDAVRSQLATAECPYATLPALSRAAFVESERANNETKKRKETQVLQSKYIPMMQSLFKVLRAHGGELTPSEAHRCMIQEEGFEEDALKQGNSLGWARNYLAEAGYVDRSSEAKALGIWRLTVSGWTVEMTDEEASRIIRAKNSKASGKVACEGALGDADVSTQRYWVYSPGAGAYLWDELLERQEIAIGWEEIGDLSAYPSKDAMKEAMREKIDPTLSFKNAAHATWQFANEMSPGDIVYAKRGMHEIIGRGVVASDYRFEGQRGVDRSNVRSIVWTHVGSWEYPGQAPMKALTDMTPFTQTLGQIKSLFEDDSSDGDSIEVEILYPLYDKDDFLADVFMSESDYDVLVGLLRRKKNVILQGAPGVGKTFAAKRLAYSIMGEKDVSRVMMVQFHQSYSYEDFIEGFRPSSAGFELTKGAFYEFCKKAADDEDNDYFFIIDEINRGNLSKIFGELFMLIEDDKRGSKNTLQLLYSREQFYVPGNVYLIGMMNTADRSLALLDYALRRRFAFFEMAPGFSSDGFMAYRDELEDPKFNELIACVERLNGVIASDESLGEGFRIGHSYFCGMEPGEVDDAKLASIVEFELIQLLKEYWFDEPAKVREWSESLRRAIK